MRGGFTWILCYFQFFYKNAGSPFPWQSKQEYLEIGPKRFSLVDNMFFYHSFIISLNVKRNT